MFCETDGARLTHGRVKDVVPWFERTKLKSGGLEGVVAPLRTFSIRAHTPGSTPLRDTPPSSRLNRSSDIGRAQAAITNAHRSS